MSCARCESSFFLLGVERVALDILRAYVRAVCAWKRGGDRR